MSGSSSNSSNNKAPQKGFFKRMLNQEESKSAKQVEVKPRHPSFEVSNEATVTPGRVSKPQAPGVVISPAIRQLNKDGYVVFNTPEKEDVYITIQPDSAFFDDEEPKMVKMAGGSFVGTKQTPTKEMPIKAEPEAAPVVITQPADIFSNANRRNAMDEIDFGEVILKKKQAPEVVIEAPALFVPNYNGIAPSVIKESYVPEAHQAVAATASAVVDTKGMAPIKLYKEEPEFKVQETPARAPFIEMPSGLYLDGNKANNTSEIEDNRMFVIPSFTEASVKAEAVVTSEAIPISIAAQAQPVVAPAPEKVEVIVEDICKTAEKEDSVTVSNVPAPVEVADLVADIMKLTVPGLHLGEDMMDESAHYKEIAIPEDGLESYDYKFGPMRSSAKKEDSTYASFFGLEG